MSEFALLPTSAWVAGLVGLALAWLVYFYVRSQPAGNERMQEIQNLVHEGAMAFLRREYMYLLPFLAVVAVLLGVIIGWSTAMAYVGGGVCSVLAGLFGMESATRANARTSEAPAARARPWHFASPSIAARSWVSPSPAWGSWASAWCSRRHSPCSWRLGWG